MADGVSASKNRSGLSLLAAPAGAQPIKNSNSPARATGESGERARLPACLPVSLPGAGRDRAATPRPGCHDRAR